MVQTLVSTANDDLDNSILFPEMLIFAGDIPLVSWSNPDVWLKSPKNPAKSHHPFRYSTPHISVPTKCGNPKICGNSQEKTQGFRGHG